MSTNINLENMRRAAERETYRDGLLEIVVAVLFFIVALATGRPAFYWTYLFAILILRPGLKRLKARFTYPRIGYFQLQDEDSSGLRQGILAWVLGVFALIAVILALTGHFTDHLAWRRAAPALGGLLFAGGFAYLAQHSRLWRHWLLAGASVAIGLLVAWRMEANAYSNLRAWAVLMALLSLVMGTFTLWRFLCEHPVVEGEKPDGK